MFAHWYYWKSAALISAAITRNNPMRPHCALPRRLAISISLGSVIACLHAPFAAADNPAEILETPAVHVIGTTPLPGLGTPISDAPANVQVYPAGTSISSIRRILENTWRRIPPASPLTRPRAVRSSRTSTSAALACPRCSVRRKGFRCFRTGYASTAGTSITGNTKREYEQQRQRRLRPGRQPR